MKILGSKRSKILLTTAIIAALAVGYGVWRIHDSQSEPKYPGPTAQEKKETQDRKKQLIEENRVKTTPEPSTTSLKQVEPVITTASKENGQIVITAYVPGVFEDGGTCTMKATKGSAAVTATTEGFGNVSTTSCPPFLIDESRFPQGGTWTVVVSYESAKASGSSQPKPLEL